MAGLTYRDAGVDIDAGEALVEKIKPLARSTHTPNVLGGLGGFAGLCGLPQDIANPVLVSGTDGVGTKLKLAFELNQHRTVGIDLVAMCVNDIITCGARPLFFLDYFATGRLDVAQGEAVVAGIADGCRQAGCALLGGETAELPGFYKSGEYDLAGFAVGVVDKTNIIDGKSVREGDIVIGLPSTGLHSNGYSLARKALLDGSDDAAVLSASFGTKGTLGEALLTPTRIYTDEAQTAYAAGAHAMCHITGGGLPGNLPRVLPDALGIVLDERSWSPPPIFETVRQKGNIARDEMRRTFNLGIGYVIVSAPEQAPQLLEQLSSAGAVAIGTVVGKPGVHFVGD